jgi:Undecaprenyl-phosphate glucose phosphotransferase
MGLEVVGFLDDHKTGQDILGTAADTARVVDRFNREGRPLDYVYIAMPPKASDRIEMIVDELSSRLVHVCLVPDLFQFNILNSRITHMAGMPVVHVIDEAPLKLSVILKRLFDVLFSVAVLLILSPLLIVLAIAVKLSSKGPVFYRQTRMGLNGQMFQMLKFRSMPVNAEEQSGPIWASKEDRRATPVGAFMRKTSLDELPQFINVLKGDMSVVGPRPERPVFIDEFKDRVPGYMLRHKTRAGITGWAQVNGWRGNTSIEKRIEYDLFYIQNWSLGLDLRIILMTLWKGLRDENAY